MTLITLLLYCIRFVSYLCYKSHPVYVFINSCLLLSASQNFYVDHLVKEVCLVLPGIDFVEAQQFLLLCSPALGHPPPPSPANRAPTTLATWKSPATHSNTPSPGAGAVDRHHRLCLSLGTTRFLSSLQPSLSEDHIFTTHRIEASL